MGLRTTISERQRRLGYELKQLRERAGLSAGEAAERIGMGRAQLSQIETAKTTILTERLRELCRLYGCKDETYVEALVAMSEATGKGWWTVHKGPMEQGPLSMAELEAGAAVLRMHQSLLIPGLFQTADYARALFTSPKLGFENIEDTLKFRMERQSVLTRENPPSVHAVIHESALHMRFGGTQVLRGQLLRLIELARLPNVTIQVYSFASRAHAALTGNFVHVIPSVPELGTVVLEQPSGFQYLGDRDSLTQYGALFESLAEYALAPVDVSLAPEAHSVKDSLALIQHLLYTL
ncbi:MULTISPECIES: helix-turn-helix domain-containing protein [Streptomyces]|uniref:Helix-turn-helix domain-containing protein n=1 Tax=Streptomyces acidicola TaxID=2596892 RepID=A0A5N8X6X3_9ACTN|nr:MULTISPECIES: helix-turn-helix transcriptional regulator [Streptomyces]MBA2807823.1 helix-turn-helix domain-containing protein [Streptomyces sp. KM273126]MPY54365.1 helix-turn-helix domain-containing protein [Streptomyces acidicola]